MQASGTYVRSDTVVARMIGGETLVVPVRGGVGDLACIYSLNGVGSVLWEALAEPKDASALVGVIVKEYDVEPEKAQQDLQLFLSEMQSAGLVRAAEVG